jgi:hypothetical protein
MGRVQSFAGQEITGKEQACATEQSKFSLPCPSKAQNRQDNKPDKRNESSNALRAKYS